MKQKLQADIANPRIALTPTLWAPIGDPKSVGRPDAIILPIDPTTTATVLPGTDLWDSWPIERRDGDIARFGTATLWMVLGAPWKPDPDERHSIARIRLMSFDDDGAWQDHGNVFPDEFTPGSREWSGSALFDESTGDVTVYFTATGQRGDVTPNFRQRIFQTSAKLHFSARSFSLDDWTEPQECVVVDSCHYLDYDGRAGGPGTIKGFRDPGYFRDPASGQEYLFFTGTDAVSSSAWNGVIGVAQSDRLSGSGWSSMPPVISAVGFNNELERPHMRCVNGLYYLFWSTQSKVFACGAGDWPTGLYGMVSPSPMGPFTPLNGDGLVAANPTEQPLQAYSWWVLNDLRVASFIDVPAAKSKDAAMDPDFQRAQFIGGPAPFFRIALEGDKATVVHT